MSPPPSPAPSADIVGTFPQAFQSAFHQLLTTAMSSPVIMVLICVAAAIMLVRLYRRLRWAALRMAEKDRRRRFTGPDRVAILARAGDRCEYHGWIGGRCTATTKLHVDHIHPYSRGGSTTPGNAQVLCSRHNKEKSNRVPYNWQLRALEKRRLSYFPEGSNRTVVRRARAHVTAAEDVK